MADEASNNAEVFVYMGGDVVVPNDVVRARVHPSVSTSSKIGGHGAL